MILQFSFLSYHARAKNSILSITGISLSKYRVSHKKGIDKKLYSELFRASIYSFWIYLDSVYL